MKEKILYILKLVIAPLFIGAVLYAITNKEEFFEVPLVIFGLILLIITVRRGVSNDKKNMNKYGKYKGDPNSIEAKQHRYKQIMLLIGALTCFLLSYVVFLLF